jgi:serine phosphatase RsbU (regulator of sigma subunit)
MQIRSFFRRKTISSGARWLIELAYPLYGFASTVERRRYWRDLPLRRASKLFAAVFFVLAGVPFFIDTLSSRSFPLVALIVISAVTGALHVVIIICELRRPRWVVLPMLLVAAAYLSLTKVPKISEPLPAREQRVVLDASCLMVAMVLGYRLFLNFANTEGIAHIQMETELALAHSLQKTLVPTVSYRSTALEAYGRTIPSAEVGGDLVDLVADAQGAFAYVADVSGHGIPAGVLMGMIKSSVRQGLLTRFSMPALLDTVNSVLPSVKEPDMFVTFAALRFDTSDIAEFTLAGHPPLLHFSQSAQRVIGRAMIQYPLGLMPDGGYVSEHVQFGPGDIFALLTDGLMETLNQNDEEFGLQRLEQLLLQNASRPLPDIFDALIAAVSAFGPQNDDRTVLLVRISAPTQPALPHPARAQPRQ